jgi:CubicO group peptidase (beta-lactamase class C family)
VFCVALLAVEGRVSFDDAIATHLPGLECLGHRVTVRQLVHHTSGIRDYLSLQDMGALSDCEVFDEARVMRVVERQRSLGFPPGSSHSYSNTGYVVLAALVRAVSGMSIAAFARERIFEPLGMHATLFREDSSVVLPNRASGYVPGREGAFRLAEVPIDVMGDGGVNTTIEDLRAWDRNFDDPIVGGPDVIALLHERGTLADGTRIDYAGGLQHGEHRGRRTVSHGGVFGGYRAMFLRFPDDRLTVAVLCNLGTMAPNLLARRVADLVLDDHVAPEPSANPAGQPVPAADRHAELFEDEQRGLFAVVDAADQLVIDLGLFAVRLAPIGDGRFAGVGVPWDLVATFAGDELRLEVDTVVEPLFVGRRVERWLPTPDELAGIEGRYTSAELDATWSVEHVGDTLRLRIDRAGERRDHELEPMRRGRFRTPGFVVDVAADALVLTSPRARQVRLDRC